MQGGTLRTLRTLRKLSGPSGASAASLLRLQKGLRRARWTLQEGWIGEP